MDYITHEHFEAWLASLDDDQPVTGNITFMETGVFVDHVDPGLKEAA